MKVRTAVAESRIPTDKSTISEGLSVKCEVDVSDREREKYQTDYDIKVFDNIIVSKGVASLKAARHFAPPADSVHAKD